MDYHLFHLSHHGQTFKIQPMDYHLFHSSYQWTCIQIPIDGSSVFVVLPIDMRSESYRWIIIFFIHPSDRLHSYPIVGSSLFILLVDINYVLPMDHLHSLYCKRYYLFLYFNFVHTNEFYLYFFNNIQEDAFSLKPHVRTTLTRMQHNVEYFLCKSRIDFHHTFM